MINDDYPILNYKTSDDIDSLKKAIRKIFKRIQKIERCHEQCQDNIVQINLTDLKNIIREVVSEEIAKANLRTVCREIPPRSDFYRPESPDWLNSPYC